MSRGPTKGQDGEMVFGIVFFLPANIDVYAKRLDLKLIMRSLVRIILNVREFYRICIFDHIWNDLG